jgi:hypothetical protein
MNIRKAVFACLVVAASLPWAPCAAGSGAVVGTFIPAPARKDMVYDETRDLVYISNQDRILRYSVANATFLPPVILEGSPRGLDLSPDGTTLAVADSQYGPDTGWVKLVELDTLGVRALEVARDYGEGGMWAVSYLADGSLVATSSFLGSGWTPMRRIDVTSGAATEIAEVRGGTMVSASGDRRVLAFAEANISDGRWGRYDAITGNIVRRQWYQDGTSWFNFEIATNAVGSQYAIPTYGGTFIYDATYTKVATFGTYAGPQPVGVAYDPVDNLAYFPWAQSSEVRVYDMDLLTEVGAYDVGFVFAHTGNGAYDNGRVRLSGDGSLLMVSVEGGVRIVRMYAPLQAASFSVTAPPRMKHKFRLQGSIGNGGAVDYEIVEQPTHGHVTLSRGYATYSGRGTGTGADTFVYRARYGRAVADGVVTVNTR